MSPITVVTLTGVIVMFASFLGVLASVYYWLALCDRRERAALKTYAAAQDEVSHYRKAA